jgi:hypothetical protein
MKLRIGGPLPFRVEMNGAMLAGCVVGIAGLAAWAASAAGLFEGSARLSGGSGPLSRLTVHDLCIGIALAGMALYFLGRVVQIVTMLRRPR